MISVGDTQRRQIEEMEKGYEFQYSPSTGRLTELADWVAAGKKRRGYQRQNLGAQLVHKLLQMRSSGTNDSVLSY